MKKILFIQNSLRIGGAEIHTASLANALSLIGYQVKIVSLDERDDIKDRINKDIECFVMGKKRYLDFKVIRKLSDIINDYVPDVIFTVNSFATMYGYLAKSRKRLYSKIVSINHTTKFGKFTEELKSIYYRRIMNKSDRVVFVSENQKEHWNTNYGINKDISLVIHNGIDINKYSNFEEKAAQVFHESDIVLGICAALRPEKRQEDLIYAIDILRKENYPVKALIIGDGVKRAEIEDVINNLNQTENVIITGYQKDVRPFIKRCDVLLLTSITETLSIAAIEGMAMEKPLILSNVGGASELVIEGVNGFLYEAGNINDLVSAIKEIIDSGKMKEMGENSLKRCKELFIDDIMIKKYDELIKDLTKVVVI